jgi:MFS family permease
VNRNVKTVLFVSVLFGAATGIYEFVLPYYLQERGLSFSSMGTVFTVAAAGMLLVRIVMGRLADVWGRKLFYNLSLAGSAVALWLTPLTGSVAGLAGLKTLREAMFLTRDAVHPVILYEESRGQFMSFLGKTRGYEFLFTGGGTVVCTFTLATLGTTGNLRLAALLLLVAFVIFALVFRETWRPHESLAKGRFRDLFSLRHMHRNLHIILLSNFIFNIGIQTGHSFIMPLFFSQKFGVSRELVSWVMVVHRVTIALPLLFAGMLAVKRLKRVFIITLALEGAIISASALVPGFYAAAAVWLLHDLVGAGVWLPIQNQIIQDHTRPEDRALEVGKILAFSGLGGIAGTYLSGVLADYDISAPFFVSGLLMIVAAGALGALRLGAPCVEEAVLVESRAETE